MIEHRAIDDELRRAPFEQVDDAREAGRRHVVEALVGPAKRMRREDHVVHRKQWMSPATGSCSNTSSAAPAMRPERNASINAGSSTTGPRATLMKCAVGLIPPH